MQEKKIVVRFQETNQIDQFNEEIQTLISQTKAFSANAYAPYSNFKVSAGLVLDNGEIIKGTNVENASYPVSICAERTLLSHAVSNYPNNVIKTMAVYVDKAIGSPVSPCGVCRQTLLEIELKQKSPIQLILVSKEGVYWIFDSAKDLLPVYFDGEAL
ncbi:cytidine deaminase [Paracrocinitomix mangrovi]|uniref:cytidine deaminase n=1 Tax=Paracrocinitomix mangrovi TaxID=2862509 RepID=UPI001C8E3B43|nr:cytidine deaminase [Paracrocinitomix mangrovi]UKN03232.1 cytidine deaminase [Paracrocinitomix mangrovi]